jgi:hypothetical protein
VQAKGAITQLIQIAIQSMEWSVARAIARCAMLDCHNSYTKNRTRTLKMQQS